MLYEKACRKINYIRYVIVFIVCTLILKMVYIQIINREEIYQKAITSWQRSFPVQANRGLILTQDNHILASNLTTSSLVVVPSQIQDVKNTARLLSKCLNVSYTLIYKKLLKKVSIQRISPEGRQLDETTASKIRKLNLPGIYLIKDTKRYYPLNTSLSHTLGFVGIDNQGLLGLELEYDHYLKGSNGSIDYYMDAKSHQLKTYPSTYHSPIDGFNIITTLNFNIHSTIERVIQNAYLQYLPDNILALAMNPKTGQILSMTSIPSFNPNNYQEYNPEIYNRNLPLWKTYEPGSTFKVITFASALNEKLFDMDKDTYLDKGYEYVGSTRIKSWKKGGHGLQTFREVLQNSSNPGFVEIGRRLGKKRLYQYIKDFGLLNKTGIDLPGESKGLMFSYDKFNALEQATVAFGQGLSLTPIQLVNAICTCVNGGYLLKPYILESIYDPISKDTIYQNKPQIIKQVISNQTSKQVCDALESVVAKGGGKNAYIEGYRIGGKTGTAQKAKNGSYIGGGYILSFVGVAPIDDPQIVLYIAMDNPKNCIQYGGTTVAPLARKIFLEILPKLNISKVNKQKQKEYTPIDKKRIKVENYIGKNKKEIQNNQVRFKYIGSGNKVIDQLPRKGNYIDEGETIVILLSND